MFEMNVRWLLCLALNLGIFLEIHSLSLPLSGCNDENDFDNESDLKFVHVFYRHGDRNALMQFPGDPHDVSRWPDGWGQLTNLGKQQQFELGKWFRSKYNGFLSPLYNSDEIYVQSTDVDRTLMSAGANLAGLYAPQGRQVWNPQLQWQPIPVHTKPVDTDYTIAASVPTTCTSYYKAREKYQKTPEFLAKLEKAKPIFDNINTNVNATFVDNFRTLKRLRDSWLCQTVHELPIPKWATPLFYNNEEFYNAALTHYYISSATPYLAKYCTGFLLKEILDRLKSKVAKTLVPDRKFWMYSSHDNTVFGFLNSLGVSDNKLVGYTATIIVELRSYKNEDYVQMIYKNFEENPYVIDIPGCGCACPLAKMYEIYDKIMPKQPFNVECTIDE